MKIKALTAEKMKDLLIVIPAYNEEKNIGRVITELKEKAGDFPLLAVDDGSTDGTGELLRTMGVKTLRHRVNLGLAEAVRTGMKYALRHGFKYSMQFDADGQHDAAAVNRLYEKAGDGDHDIVIGSRYAEEKGSHSLRTLGGNLISLCIRLVSGERIKDPTSGMRLYDRRVMECFAASSHYSPEPDTLSYLISRGIKVTEVQVSMNERMSGRSYLDITESLRYMFRMCSSILLLQWIRR